MAHDWIAVRGARVHNLRNIDVDLPRERLVVITGLSGSGKSSLAFDTIYAEGQRRYVESLSAYARQFLEQMEKPDVDLIEGLSPAISIEQKTTASNPRSTVGTVTEIYDYLRLLFANIGVPHCPNCGREIASQSLERIIDLVMTYPQDERINVLAPLVRGRKGEFRKELEALRTRGFTKARIDGQFRSLEDDIKLDRRKNHTIEVVVDRLIVRSGIERRLTESIETALQLANEIVVINGLDEGDRLFSRRMACVNCGISVPELSPRAFSFNSPHGACPACQGLGAIWDFDPARVVPDPSKSLADGAIAPWARGDKKLIADALASLSETFGIALGVPFGRLPKKHRDLLLYGPSGEAGAAESARERKAAAKKKKKAPAEPFGKDFEGILPNLRRRYSEATWSLQEDMEPYRALRDCPECHGERLKPESRAVRVKGRRLWDYVNLPIADARAVFGALELSDRESIIAGRILKEIQDRLRFLHDVGVGYLTIARSAATLSGGEGQRIRLATQIGSNLTGVLYVLDEPSIGLHQRDNRALLTTLGRLRDLGNTVVVVEHDEETIRKADYVVDLGPGAGEHGGRVIFQGTPAELLGLGPREVTSGTVPRTSEGGQSPDESLTGAYLRGERRIEAPASRRPALRGELTIRGARAHNLKNVDVSIPLGTFVAVTGVSGSGKSTLVNDILYKSLARTLYRASDEPGPHDAIDGVPLIDKVIEIDQSPIGRTPRSNPATYTGLFTFIRELFAMLPDAKQRGFRPGRFSFNVKGGRCEACQGDGVIAIEMHFLPNVYVTCEECKGKRYNRETLEIRYRGKSVADVLDLTVDQALPLLENVPPIAHKLRTLKEVGLGYIELGQSATTLSGGEAQRVKLARELSKRGTGRTLYILDEPTTGLHFEDVKKLLDVLGKLVDQGNTVLVIEHNLDVVRTADHVIDLGPEGGEGGGRIVAQGTPEEVARTPGSHTGGFLAQALGSAASVRRAV